MIGHPMKGGIGKQKVNFLFWFPTGDITLLPVDVFVALLGGIDHFIR